MGEIANGFVEKTTIKRHYYFQINELNFFPELHEQHSSTIKKHRLRYGMFFQRQNVPDNIISIHANLGNAINRSKHGPYNHVFDLLP